MPDTTEHTPGPRRQLEDERRLWQRKHQQQKSRIAELLKALKDLLGYADAYSDTMADRYGSGAQ